jgi:uncharacterized cupredoxin-like copper-binding protein
MKKSTLFSAVVAGTFLAMSGIASAAGGHSDGHSNKAGGMPGEASNVSRTIQVAMHDNYYEPEEIDVKAGETVKFVVENQGQLVHEFNIGTAEMHEAHQEEMMMMVQHGVIQGGTLNRDKMDMDMGDGKSMKHDDPNSVLLEPGDTAEVVWKFGEASSLEFACNVPGHYAAGMQGDIDIQ